MRAMRVTGTVLGSLLALAGCDRGKAAKSEQRPADNAHDDKAEPGDPGEPGEPGEPVATDESKPPKKTSGPPREASGSPVLAAVFDGKNWTFIDTNGARGIDGAWPLTRRFSSGLAAVNVGGERSPLGNGVLGGHYEYIDPTGAVVLEGPFENPGVFWNDRLVTMVSGKGAVAFDKAGTAVASGYDDLEGYYGGLSYARKGEEAGFLKPDGSWAFELPAATKVGAYHGGYVSFSRDGETWGFMDAEGQVSIEPSFEVAGQFWNGLAVVERDGKFGFIDTAGEVAGTIEWDDALPCHEQRCPVRRGKVWGYVDQTGAVAIEPQFQDMRDFHSGKAAFLRDGKVGYVGLDGSIVIEPEWEAAYDFHFGRAVFSDGANLGYIDEDGVQAIAAQYVRAERFVDVTASNEADRFE